MNRREFLKLGVAACAAVTLPAAAEKKSTAGAVELSPAPNWAKAGFAIDQSDVSWPDFDPSAEYANGMLLTARPSPEVADKLVTTLYEDMVKHIPPPYRDRVEIQGPIPIDFGRSIGISWHYIPPWRKALS